MIIRSSIFAIVLISSACGLLTKKNTDQSLKTISFHATVHKPYCGGAKPSPDVAAGYYEDMKFEKFKIVKGTVFKEGMEALQEISLNEAGSTVFTLPVGEYMLVRSDKFLPLDQFIKLNGPMESKYYKIKGDDCFKEWKNKADLHFKIESDTTIELLQQAKCWIGTNSCIEYVGPPAP